MENIKVNNGNYISRFVTSNDKFTSRFVFKLPKNWWSRPYEYSWVSNFTNGNDVVLDAASGINHPLKFYLNDVCKKVYAVDLDIRILSSDEIVKDVKNVFGSYELRYLKKKYLKNIEYLNCDIRRIPLMDGTFDKIFCVSVLEHLQKNKTPDFLNKLGFNFSHDMCESLREFKRLLKPQGLIILTFDYPTVNLNYFCRIVDYLGLEFCSKAYFNLPKNALRHENDNLYCYRALLKKK